MTTAKKLADAIRIIAPIPDREEPVGGTRRRRGMFATQERCRVGQAGILEQNPPAVSMPPPANQSGTASMPRGFPALALGAS